MGLAGFKQMSYVVPVFLALDVIAAFGLVRAADAIGRLPWWRGWRWLPAALIVGMLALQALIVLPRHPYYGTHHNALLGGSRVAQHVLPFQDQGEGLDLAARYLNTSPRAQWARVMIYKRNSEVFKRDFIGYTSTESDLWATYRVSTLQAEITARDKASAEVVTLTQQLNDTLRIAETLSAAPTPNRPTDLSWPRIVDAVRCYDPSVCTLLSISQEEQWIALGGKARSRQAVLDYAAALETSGAFDSVLVESVVDTTGAPGPKVSPE